MKAEKDIYIEIFHVNLKRSGVRKNEIENDLNANWSY
jgi:hypothetical protein